MSYLQILDFLLFQFKKVQDISFSTIDALSKQAFAVQDTFSDGEFEIEISLNSEETNTKVRFKVYVDTNYLNLRMNMLPQPARTKRIKSKILNIFK